MLGWHISVYRQANGGASPAQSDSPQGQRIAVWQTGLGGLNWLYELVKAGAATVLAETGYPTMFTARARHLLGPIQDGPPEANPVWVSGPDDILTDAWVGKTAIDEAGATQCDSEEWLVVEAWDESQLAPVALHDLRCSVRISLGADSHAPETWKRKRPLTFVRSELRDERRLGVERVRDALARSKTER